MESAGVEVKDEYTVGPANAPAFATEEDGYDGMMRLAKLSPRPTAILARNDFAAIGAMRAAHKLGLQIPQDIAVAGFDNIPLASYWTPSLTTVSQPIREQGKLAARILLDRIEGKLKGEATTHTMGCEVVLRESTGE